MTKFLDGKKEAEKIAQFFEESEKLLGKSLVILQCDGHTEESTYVRLKREMGERLGVMVSVLFAKNKGELAEMVKHTNNDETVDGILIQLPVVGADKEETDQILSTISVAKDVDGLNPKSSFIPAVVRAVERTMEIFKISKSQKIAVVGYLGGVGGRLVKRLENLGFDKVGGFDKEDNLTDLKKYDVVISSTGAGGIIKKEMVKKGFVGIDLGYPTGDFDKDVFDLASMVTPVPGGVGPLTVVCLFENLAEA